MSSTKVIQFFSFIFLFAGALFFFGPKEEPIYIQLNGLKKVYKKGDDFLVQSIKEKPLIVHFWASWCEPCRVELLQIMASLSQISPYAEFILISLDDKEEDILKFLNSMILSKDLKKLTSEQEKICHWDQHKKLAHELGTFKVPETYFFSKEGRLVRKVAGELDWFNSANRAFIQAL